MMNTIKDPIRAGRSYWAMLLLSLLCITTVWAQTPTLPASPTACDYTSEPATISLTAQNVPAGYNTLYLLVNMTSGMIVQTNATAPVFNGVSRGLYYAVAAHYSSSLNNASMGKLISDVYALDECLTYGPTLGLRVCSSACDYAIPPSSVTFTAQNVPPGVSTTYTLVNEATNLIVQTSTTASFSGVTTGDYAITSVHYTGSLTALAAGNRLYDVTTQNRDGGPANCLSVSNTLHIKVCNNPIAITGPPNGATVASLNPPISGTASPGASVTVTGGPGSMGGPCIATADLNGNWSCSSLTFPAGPASVTATDGTTTATSSFTVAPLVPPTVSILTPATNETATTTPTISGTATPNAVVTLTGGPGSTGGPVSVTADPAGVFSTSAITFPTGPASLTAVAVTTGGISTPAVTSFTAVPVFSLVRVNAKVILAGAYVTATGLMRDDLRTKSLIPTADPYSTTALASSFTHTAGSAGTSISTGVLSVTGNDAIVDWVFVQLRDPLSATTVIATRAALLQRDGDIVDLDGTSPLSFTSASASANFYVSVRHRNHLGVMTQSPVALSSSPLTVDFTDPTTPIYGVAAERLITLPSSATVATLWPGNANINKTVIYQGSGNDLGTILSQVLLAPGNSVPPVKTFIVTGYLTGDLNLDGNVIYQGSGNELGTVLGTVLLHPANSVPPVKTFIVSEQLP